MNTLYTQYLNEARTAQYQQEQRQAAATVRAFRSPRPEPPEQGIAESRPSYPRRLLRTLAALL